MRTLAADVVSPYGQVDLTLPGPMEGDGVSGRTSGRRPAIAWSVTAVIVLESLYALFTVSRAYFYQDDFLDLALARQLGLGKHLLEQGIFGHFLPGFNLVNYFLAGIVPYQWSIVEVSTVILYALTLVLVYRLLTTFFGPMWLSVVLVALAGASFTLVPAVAWWPQGLQQLVTIPALLFLIDCHVRYVTTGKVRFAVIGGVSLMVALAFYDGAVVGALFVVLMTVLIWPIGRGMRGVVTTLLLHWPAWLCYGVPVAADLGWRLTHASLYILPPSPAPIQALDFISLTWTQTFVPLLFGIDAWLLPTHLDRLLAGVLGQAVLVLFVVWTIVRRRDAWRAWVLLVVMVLTMSVLVGLTRVSTFGPGDASDVRYVTLDSVFFLIIAALALNPARSSAYPASVPGSCTPVGVGAVGPVARQARRHVRPLTRRPALLTIYVAVLCAAVGLYATGLHFDRQRYVLVQEGQAMRTFFQNFSRSWEQVQSTAHHPYLWDTEIDASVVSHSFFPFDTAALTVGKLHKGIPLDVWGGSGYVVQQDGSVTPATTATQATGVLPTPGGACVTPGNQAGSINIVLDHPLQPGIRWFGILSYTSRTDAVAAESSGSLVHFRSGSGTVITEYSPVPLASVAWIIPARADVCITGFRIVVPVAEPDGSTSGAG